MNTSTEDAHCARRILVVEDDAGIRDTLRDLLEIEGYAVDTAEHGRAGLELLQAAPAPPCLILLDLMMPVMDGWQFLAELHGRPQSPLAQVPVAVVSALDDLASLAERYRCDVLRKPIDVDALLHTAQRHCPA